MTKFNFYVLPLSADVLEFITGYLKEKYNFKNLEKVSIIFGGKRPSIVLKKYLSEYIQHPFLPPKIFSIDEFVQYILSKKDNLTIAAELDIVYLIYELLKDKPVFKTKFKNFIKFIPWGYEILHFIDELWLEDIKPEELQNIQLQAEIGFNIPVHINELLKVLKFLTENLQQKLLANKLTTRGFLYNLAVKSSEGLNLTEFSELVFVTPFYLHTTEFKIISNIIESNNVTIIFQGDKKEFKQLEILSRKFNIDISTKLTTNDDNKKIYFYSSFDKISEMNFVYNILNKIPTEEIEKTLVVLPDDKSAVLLPNFLPDKIKDFNLVCGYPFKHSLIYSIFYSIFNTQINKKKKGYYSKDYLDVIKNPVVKKIILTRNISIETVTSIVNSIEKILLGEIPIENISRSAFVDIKKIQNCKELYYHLQKNLPEQLPVKVIKEILHDLHLLLFKQWEKITNIHQLCRSVKTLLDRILKNINETEVHQFEIEIINKLYDYIDNLATATFSKLKFKPAEVYKFILEEFDKLKIPLYGSPLKGLQILGFYETRNLNFKNVIILDANEGILPYLSIRSSFIPRQIMINFGIDRIEIEEEIQRYYFKRLISQAENIHIIYIESNEKEKSRFVEQLIWQQQIRQNKVEIENIYQGYQKVSLIPQKFQIKKSEDVIEHLNTIEYSATMLDTYLQCPLKFYYSYVLSLQEQEFIDEPEGKDIGKFVHELLEITFKEFLGKKPLLDGNFRQKFFEMFNYKFNNELEKQFISESFLLKQVMEHFFNIFIDYEQQRIDKHKVECILKLEDWFFDTMTFDGKSLKFKYKIDRIDKLENGTLLVIDYKTGSLETPVKNLKLDTYTREVIKQKIKSFQLPLYVYIVNKKFSPPDSNAMLYSIKNPDESKLLFSENVEQIKKEQFWDEIMSALRYIILDEILNPEVTFYADDSNSRICDQCSFKYLCR